MIVNDDRNLTPEDLALLGRALVLAGGTVAIARYSGARGTAQEFEVIITEAEALRREHPDNPILQGLPIEEMRRDAAALARDHDVDPTQMTYQDFKMSALNRLSQANEVLARKATQSQAEAYRQGIVRICERVAQARSEGGFLGIGATPVDYREAAAIEEIRRVLGP
jgi:hypothetical protein